MPPEALFVTYLYPPVGGMSPKVALHYVRALSRAGWRVDVVTPDPSPHHLVYKLDDNLRDVGVENVTVHRTYPGPFYRMSCRAPGSSADGGNAAARGERARYAARARAVYRGLVRPWIVPDGRIDWYPWAMTRSQDLMKRRRYDLLLTLGFPFTPHLVGLALHGRAPMPWVIHQGDVWSFQPGAGFPRWRGLVDHRLEAAVLERAGSIIVNTEATVDGYVERFPTVPRGRYAVIPTGYDPKLYAEAVPETSRRFRLVYTGEVSDAGHGHATLLDAIALARDRGATDIEFVIAGDLTQGLRDHAARLRLGDVVDFRGYQPTGVVTSLQKGADVLVLFGMVGGLQVPSKLYEYHAARRPMLVVPGDDRDVAARDVIRNRRGVVVADDVESMAGAILRLRDLWSRGALDAEFDLASVPALSWDEFGDRFMRAVEQAMEPAHA